MPDETAAEIERVVPEPSESNRIKQGEPSLMAVLLAELGPLLGVLPRLTAALETIAAKMTVPPAPLDGYPSVVHSTPRKPAPRGEAGSARTKAPLKQSAAKKKGVAAAAVRPKAGSARKKAITPPPTGNRRKKEGGLNGNMPQSGKGSANSSTH
jgi:hypothetical protein